MPRRMLLAVFVVVACGHPPSVTVPMATEDAAPPSPDAGVMVATGDADLRPGVRITGVTDQAIHEHGGAEAKVSSARFVVENGDAVAHTIVVEGVDFLSDHGAGSCQGAAEAFDRKLTPNGLRFDDPTAGHEHTRSLAIPPRTTRGVEIRFTTVGAYYTSCDRFGFRAHFEIDGVRISAVAALMVGRIEPYHP